MSLELFDGTHFLANQSFRTHYRFVRLGGVDDKGRCGHGRLKAWRVTRKSRRLARVALP